MGIGNEIDGTIDFTSSDGGENIVGSDVCLFRSLNASDCLFDYVVTATDGDTFLVSIGN